MKLVIAMFVVGAMACGGKAKPSTTPDNTTGTTESQNMTQGTGGATYGGAAYGGMPYGGTPAAAPTK